MGKPSPVKKKKIAIRKKRINSPKETGWIVHTVGLLQEESPADYHSAARHSVPAREKGKAERVKV